MGPNNSSSASQYMFHCIRLANEPANLRKFLFRWSILPRRDNQMNGRPAVPYRLRQPQPAKRAGHLNVGKNDADIGPAFQHLNCRVAIGCFHDRVAGILQHVGGTHANYRFVFDDKDSDVFQRIVLALVRVLRSDEREIGEGAHRYAREAERLHAALTDA